MTLSHWLSQFTMRTKCWTLLWALVVTLLSCGSCVGSAGTKLIQTLEDDIGAENFTYYRLQRPGNLRLELTSLKGDVDVYISSEIQHPDYYDYDVKSESCGVDIIQISPDMPRPVYISLFGHPNNLMSRYQLSILETDEQIVDDYEALVNKYERYYYEEMEGGSDYSSDAGKPSQSSQDETSHYDHKAEDELPLWWKILLGVLEFGIEVIL